MTSPGSVCQFKNKSKNQRMGEGGQHTDVKRREGEDPDQNNVPLFDLLFSCLSYYNLYGSYKHDVLLIDNELTH